MIGSRRLGEVDFVDNGNRRVRGVAPKVRVKARHVTSALEFLRNDERCYRDRA